MTTAAIPHGTITGRKYHHCHCLDCYNADARYQETRRRKMAYGTWQPLVDAAPARAHVEALNRQGMTWQQIAHQAGIRPEELRRLRMPLGGRPRTERIRPDRAAKLLALAYVPVAAAPKAMIPSIGAVRRLQALRVIGWPIGALADRSGIHRHTIAMILRQPFVQAATHERIVELYDDLHDQDPRRHGIGTVAVRRAIEWADAQGWAAPNRWHGDIDHPDTRPGQPSGPRYAEPEQGHRRQAVIDDTTELLSYGCGRDEISNRLGLTWGAIMQAHRRAGAPLPEVHS